MTNPTLRAHRRDLAMTAVLVAAPLHRGRILRGLARRNGASDDSSPVAVVR